MLMHYFFNLCHLKSLDLNISVRESCLTVKILLVIERLWHQNICQTHTIHKLKTDTFKLMQHIDGNVSKLCISKMHNVQETQKNVSKQTGD